MAGRHARRARALRTLWLRTRWTFELELVTAADRGPEEPAPQTEEESPLPTVAAQVAPLLQGGALAAPASVPLTGEKADQTLRALDTPTFGELPATGTAAGFEATALGDLQAQLTAGLASLRRLTEQWPTQTAALETRLGALERDNGVLCSAVAASEPLAPNAPLQPPLWTPGPQPPPQPQVPPKPLLEASLRPVYSYQEGPGYLTEYRRHWAPDGGSTSSSSVAASCDSGASAAYWAAYNEWYRGLDARAKLAEDNAIQAGYSHFVD